MERYSLDQNIIGHRAYTHNKRKHKRIPTVPEQWQQHQTQKIFNYTNEKCCVYVHRIGSHRPITHCCPAIIW